MACCGLLHNLSCDDAIKRHVVKLGGREASERLASHSDSAVRNLARVLLRTLKPPAETSDPFGALFATRTPGLSAPRRVASRRDKKHAQAALRGVGHTPGDAPAKEVQDYDDSTPRRRRRRRKSRSRTSDDDEVMSQASASSAGSCASNGSGGSGQQRRPGERKQPGPRRFSKSWDDANGHQSQAAVDAASSMDVPLLPNIESDPFAGRFEVDDDAVSVASAGTSASEARTELSLEMGEGLEDVDIASTIEKTPGVRIRREVPEQSQRNPRMKQRRAREGITVRDEEPADAGSVAQMTLDFLAKEDLPRPAAEPRPASTPLLQKAGSGTGLGERLRRSVSNLEEAAQKRLDQVGRDARQKLAASGLSRGPATSV
eukprot:TRINITY_DN49895_c0_g1_i1.p1 TRINITY_DN49895_c0_g1~~TRINITY_DN49895_c0_g1_i1.p1  ORF type:complete len:374 (-),score=65.73 TRINITY_DN49895_c0_g1_i1:129-1250(-)